jgi:hypothetical protein
LPLIVSSSLRRVRRKVELLGRVLLVHVLPFPAALAGQAFTLFGTSARQRRLEVAIDELAERFGEDVVYRANDLTPASGGRLAPTLDFLDDRTRG